MAKINPSISEQPQIKRSYFVHFHWYYSSIIFGFGVYLLTAVFYTSFSIVFNLDFSHSEFGLGGIAFWSTLFLPLFIICSVLAFVTAEEHKILAMLVSWLIMSTLGIAMLFYLFNFNILTGLL